MADSIDVTTTSDNTDDTSPLVSEFVDDPEMRELVEFFIEDLHRRLATLATAREHGDWKTVCGISHQLRGSAAGYGFPTLGEIAARVEDSLKSGRSTTCQYLRNDLDALALTCHRIFSSAGRRAA